MFRKVFPAAATLRLASAGGGTRTPNTDILSVLPLPIGLHPLGRGVYFQRPCALADEVVDGFT